MHDTPEVLAYAFGEPLPGRRHRIGGFVRCTRPSGALERLGPAHGFHDPQIVERADMLRLLGATFNEGALISNGHHSLWNHIPEADNRAAREAPAACARVR